MIKYIKIIILFFSTYSFGQTNLIRNYSFEINSFNGNCFDAPTPQMFGDTQDDLQAYWDLVDYWDCPEKKNFCASGAASADVRCVSGFSHSGIYYGHTVGEEAIVQALGTPINTGETIYYEFYVKSKSSFGNIVNVGMKFYNQRPNQCGYHNLYPHPFQDPQVVSAFKHDFTWKKVSGYWTADDDYTYVAFTDFFEDADVYWDDIKIFKQDNCPPVWLIENNIFDGEHNIYQAADKIIAGEDVNPDNINGPVIVKSNSEIIYKAANQVIIEPGFSTEPGAFFMAYIAPCEADPCPDPPTLQNVQLCDGEPAFIGNADVPGVFYEWSPSTYLDNPNVSNPLFIPPSGSGSITYNVNITSVCNFFDLPGFDLTSDITTTVTVQYNSNPNPTPVISLSNISFTSQDVSFDATVANEAQYITIDFYDVSNGNLVLTEQLEQGIDFTAPFLSWSTQLLDETQLDILSACKDYNIVVSTSNYCFLNTVSQTIFWDRPSTISIHLFPNVFSPPFDPNGELCIDVSGADNFTVQVVEPPAFTIYNGSGNVFTNPVCIWDGTINENCVDCGDLAESGTYAVYVSFTNDCGELVDYSQLVNLFPDPKSMHFIDTISQLDQLNLLVYPNPTQGKFQISTNSVSGKILVYDSSGKLIIQHQVCDNKNVIDLSQKAPGIYLVRLEDQGKSIFKKVIRQ